MALSNSKKILLSFLTIGSLLTIRSFLITNTSFSAKETLVVGAIPDQNPEKLKMVEMVLYKYITIYILIDGF